MDFIGDAGQRAASAGLRTGAAEAGTGIQVGTTMVARPGGAVPVPPCDLTEPAGRSKVGAEVLQEFGVRVWQRHRAKWNANCRWRVSGCEIQSRR